MTENTALKPSEVYDKVWLYADDPDGIKDPGDFCGKWMLFIPVNRLDETWERIKAATEAGRLGIQAKAATMKDNSNAQSSKVKLICVYSHDFRDLADVTILLGKLRQLGFAGRLNYKEDNATRALKYGEGASLYTSPSGLTIKQLRAGMLLCLSIRHMERCKDTGILAVHVTLVARPIRFIVDAAELVYLAGKSRW